jgi:hypothetical protein
MGTKKKEENQRARVVTIMADKKLVSSMAKMVFTLTEDE